MLNYLMTQTLNLRIWAILHGTIGASNASVPRLAAIELDNLYTDYATRSQPVEAYEFIQHVWEGFIRLAGQLDRDRDGHSQLARIIMWLKKLPLTQLPEVIMLDDNDAYHEPRRIVFLWDGLNRIDRHLPPFHESEFYPATVYCTRKAWLTLPDLWSNEAEFQEYLNAHAFAALLTELYLISIPWQATAAIEEVTEGTIVQENGEEVVTRDIRAVEHLDQKAAVAGIWLVHAAHRLWYSGTPNNISQGGPWWQNAYSGMSKENWSLTAMHLERLLFWKNQFDEIINRGDVSAMTWGIAVNVVDKMDTLLKGHSRGN
ncbi:hypothetical protein ABOM_004573 [Aspergillus bombycis]|uniref:Uncharacterized protein n=1 Tax=Aspergillus bombycis TaxID=109264 RepID=A0A1F8A483_9EURO|nr:hypothetical protein ABOM_004573 [Aspergillus bombycis]OGM46531.1 hypothetical protein ABOM_004573 [Aspergillus bombycis]